MGYFYISVYIYKTCMPEQNRLIKNGYGIIG